MRFLSPYLWGVVLRGRFGKTIIRDKTGGVTKLYGSKEWYLPTDPKQKALTQSKLDKLKEQYLKEGGIIEEKPVPEGTWPHEYGLPWAEIDCHSGNIKIYMNDKALLPGLLAEELLHYFQLKKRGLLGKEKLSAKERNLFEGEVVGLLEKMGFVGK